MTRDVSEKYMPPPPWCKIQNYYVYVQGIGATPAPSLVLIKRRGQKILTGQHLVYRPTYRPTDIPPDSCKTICPLFQGGHKNSPSFA